MSDEQNERCARCGEERESALHDIDNGVYIIEFGPCTANDESHAFLAPAASEPEYIIPEDVFKVKMPRRETAEPLRVITSRTAKALDYLSAARVICARRVPPAAQTEEREPIAWKAGDEAITKESLDRVRLLHSVVRPDSRGQNWLVKLARPRAGHLADLVPFQAHEGNLMLPPPAPQTARERAHAALIDAAQRHVDAMHWDTNDCELMEAECTVCPLINALAAAREEDGTK